tara:strand:+ start:510 stop:1232 length:723 start_codon:yes stop_codon:yes gene_type:complete
MKISLLIPIINEEEGIKVIMPRVKKEWVDQILFVDGGSTDNSVQLCKDMGYEIFTQTEKGPSAAYREAMEKLTGDVIIDFSPDNNSIPEKIPELIDKMKSDNYDMVIVSRYLKGAKSEDDTFLSAIGNWFFTKSINLFHGGNYTDSLVMFRAYKKNLFYRFKFDDYKTFKIYDKIFFTKIGIHPLLSVRAAKAKLKVSEIPGDEPERIGGVSKMQLYGKLRWAFAYYSQILLEIIFNRKL